MTRATDTSTATLDDTLNSIIARFPEALPILHGFGLDTCCGGALPLRDAIARHQLDEAQVVAALARFVRPPGA